MPTFTFRAERTSRAVVRRDFEPWFDRYGLGDGLPELPESDGRSGSRRRASGGSGTRRWLTGGRGPVRLLSAGDLGDAVVRPYRRGGLVRHLTSDRFFLGDRAFRELEVTEQLRRWNLPVPEPLAAVQYPAGAGYRAVLVTRKVPGVRPAPWILEAESADRESAVRRLRAIGRAVGRFHRAGLWHRDLNAHNLLLPPGRPSRPYVVDFDRARIFPGRTPLPIRWLTLRRLRRSLQKLELEASLRAWDALESAHEAELRPG